MGRTGAGLFLAVLVVAALGSGYLAVSSGRQVSTSTSTLTTTLIATSTTTATSTPTATATDPTNGLELRLYLNATSPSATGANVSLFADVYNPSSSTANVTSANDWVVPLNGSMANPAAT
jgi:hypothetical protein